MIETKVIKVNVDINVKTILDCYSKKCKKNKKEYGGILLGRVSDDGEVFIEIATRPSLFDTSFALSFIRSKANAQKHINYWWEKSNGTINYVGEWHTHPFPSNIPSMGDINMLKEAMDSNDNVYNFIIMIITGTNKKISVTLATYDKIITVEGAADEQLQYKFR